jgi:hypothetical protein
MGVFGAISQLSEWSDVFSFAADKEWSQFLDETQRSQGAGAQQQQ